MKSIGHFLALLMAVSLCVGALGAQRPSILESRVERHQGPPLWISAETVADKEKIIDLDLIGSDFLRRSVDKQWEDLGGHMPADKSRTGEKPPITRIPPAECKSSIGSSDVRGGDTPGGTLGELASYSKSIFRGTIRSVELGFSFGEPGSLLGVDLSEVIKGRAPKSPFYIDYPVARFRIGPLSFCNLNVGYEPRPGDEVLLFDSLGPVDRDDVLYSPRLDQLFFQNSSGVLFLPPALKNASGLKTVRTLDDVVSALRSGGLLNSREGAP